MRFSTSSALIFFAAAIDQIFLSPLDHVVPRGMLPHQVARPVKTVRGEGAGIVLRHAEVAAQGVRTAATQFAHVAERNFVVVFIQNPHFIIRADGTSHRFETNVLRIVNPHEHDQAFRHPEVFLNEGAWDQFPREQPNLRLEALPATLDVTQ